MAPVETDGSDAAPVLGWTLDNPAYHHFWDVSGSSPESMVAVGSGGLIARLIDGEWVDVGPKAFPGTIGAVWSAGPDHFFVTDRANDRVLRFKGGEWTVYDLLHRCRPNDIWGASPTSIFVVTHCDGVFHFDGTEWREVFDRAGWSIHGRSADDVYTVLRSGGIAHYDGQVWSEVELPDEANGLWLYWIWVSPSGHVWAVGAEGTLLHFDGSDWALVDVGTDAYLYDVWGDGTDVFVTGRVRESDWPNSTGVILHYDGSTWTSTAVPTGVVAVTGTDAHDVWALGDHGGIYHYDGSAWSTVQGRGRSARLLAVHGSSGANVYATGDGTVLYYDGAGWTEVRSSSPFQSLRGVWVRGGDDVFVVGEGPDPILHYDGADWAPMASPISTLNGVWGSTAGELIAVGPGGGVVRDDGTGWTEVASGTGNRLGDVWGASATDVYAVGNYPAGEADPWNDTQAPDEPGIVHFDGRTWSGVFPSHMAFYLNGAWGTGSDDVFAVGQGGLILHWDGEEWREMDSGTSADLHDVWGDAPDNVFAVGAAGTVLQYDGRRWKPVPFPFALRAELRGVWLDESSDVVIVGSAGVILRGVR